jgi:hypothetical protein
VLYGWWDLTAGGMLVTDALADGRGNGGGNGGLTAKEQSA